MVCGTVATPPPTLASARHLPGARSLAAGADNSITWAGPRCPAGVGASGRNHQSSCKWFFASRRRPRLFCRPAPLVDCCCWRPRTVVCILHRPAQRRRRPDLISGRASWTQSAGLGSQRRRHRPRFGRKVAVEMEMEMRIKMEPEAEMKSRLVGGHREGAQLAGERCWPGNICIHQHWAHIC